MWPFGPLVSKSCLYNSKGNENFNKSVMCAPLTVCGKLMQFCFTDNVIV